MVWPENVIARICEAMGELTHVDECEILNDEEKIGNVEIILRLQIKCQEIEDESIKTGDDIRKNLDKVICPHDILFIVGKAAKDDSCMALLPEPDKGEHHTTALDLSRYRSMNGRLVQTPDVLNTCMNVECCELKVIYHLKFHIIILNNMQLNSNTLD